MGLPVELRVEDKKILIVGGGGVAERRLSKLLEFDPALVRIVAGKVSERVKALARGSGNVEIVERDFAAEDLAGMDLAFIATGDHELNGRIARMAKEKGILVNVADDPDRCDFFVSASVRRGRLLISVSSGGSAPSISAALKDLISQRLPLEEVSRALELISDMRREFIGRGYPLRKEVISALSRDLVRRAVSGNKKGIYLLGLDHHTAPLPVRERALPVLRAFGEELDEAVVLATCNRVELYFSTERPEEVIRRLPGELKAGAYFRVNEDAFAHLSLVAAGCRSLALGETQIACQVKRAYGEARNAGKVGKLLGRFFEQALRAAKEIRNKTGIQCAPISIPSLAVRFARKELGVLSRRAVGILGTGEVARLLLAYLDRDGVYLIGRNRRKLSSLSRKYSAVPVPIHELEGVLGTLDLLFVATSSPRPLLKRQHLESAVKEKLLIVDLSVPRGVEEGAEALPNVEVIHVDDLAEEAARNRKMKEERLKEAEAVARSEAEGFRRWYEGLEADEVVIALLNELKRVPAETLLKRAIGRLKADPALAGAFREALGL